MKGLQVKQILSHTTTRLSPIVTSHNNEILPQLPLPWSLVSGVTRVVWWCLNKTDDFNRSSHILILGNLVSLSVCIIWQNKTCCQPDTFVCQSVLFRVCMNWLYKTRTCCVLPQGFVCFIFILISHVFLRKWSCNNYFNLIFTQHLL